MNLKNIKTNLFQGIEIMFNYRFGSLSMSYLADSLAVPSVRWIGIYPSEIETLSIPKVRLTKAEIKKLREMIARKYIDEFLKYELEMMLKSKFKAEIEGISDISLTFFINDYIPGKIRRNAYELV
jgi:meiotic recombination protein SPO11